MGVFCKSATCALFNCAMTFSNVYPRINARYSFFFHYCRRDLGTSDFQRMNQFSAMCNVQTSTCKLRAFVVRISSGGVALIISSRSLSSRSMTALPPGDASRICRQKSDSQTGRAHPRPAGSLAHCLPLHLLASTYCHCPRHPVKGCLAVFLPAA